MSLNNFSIQSTNAGKGVALILLLWHHLFYQHPEFGYITFQIALLSKVCVAIFVMLSGYGFSESVKSSNIGLFAFYQKRLITLYSNYWFVAFIFVFIGIFLMDRSLQDAFTGDVYTKFLIQMTGLHRFFYNELGYNATWWYMSVIIPLIILFPFIYDSLKKYGVLVLVFFLAILLPNKAIFPVITIWLLPFALGVYFSQRNLIVKISSYLNKYNNWRFIILLAAIIFTAGIRQHLPLLGGIKIDWLFGGLIILFTFEVTSKFHLIEKILSFLGTHLFNIFLFHTFIYHYFWSEFIYSFKSPVLIFLNFLIICIIVSLMINYIKKVVFFDKLVNMVYRIKIPKNLDIPFQQNASANAKTVPTK